MSFVSLPKKPEVVTIEPEGYELPEFNIPTQAKKYDLAELLARLKDGLPPPDAVVSWLFCARYDIFDIATRLALSGYKGRVIAVSPPLPDKRMVLRELREAFPMLHFDIWFAERAKDTSVPRTKALEAILEDG
ncbi:hypothetical protein DZK27_06830 [Rhodobacteraceae bacterium 63075]|nr:hypothetical protein DZK27_06830 [Rhodobacteraceae bacterium 63075]